MPCVAVAVVRTVPRRASGHRSAVSPGGVRRGFAFGQVPGGGVISRLECGEWSVTV